MCGNQAIAIHAPEIAFRFCPSVGEYDAAVYADGISAEVFKNAGAPGICPKADIAYGYALPQQVIDQCLRIALRNHLQLGLQ